MKKRYFSLFADGFVGSFQVACGLILAIVSTISTFASPADVAKSAKEIKAKTDSGASRER